MKHTAPVWPFMETTSFSFHVCTLVTDVLETFPSVCDTLKTRKTMPFPAGRSLVSGALMSDGASSGKPNLLFFLICLFCCLTLLRLLSGPTEPLLPTSPITQSPPPLSPKGTLSLLYHPDYRHIFLKRGPSWLIRHIDLFNSLDLLIPTRFTLMLNIKIISKPIPK